MCDINKLLNSKYIQNSKSWFEKRHNIISATNVSSILGSNKYCSRNNLLKRKSSKFSMDLYNEENEATMWGIKYEPIAKNIYEKICNKNINEIGLIMHDKYNYIGASPDGLIIDNIKNKHSLLEIKCLFKRKNFVDEIDGNIPYMYWIQCQIQMEVCDIDTCDMFQCKFIESDNIEDYNKWDNKYKGILNKKDDKITYWRLDDSHITYLKRDKEWFKKIYPNIKNFWNQLQRCRNGESIINMYNLNNVRNFMNDDPIIDWFDKYANISEKDNISDFNITYYNNNIKYKNYIYNNLCKKFGSNNIIKYRYSNDFIYDNFVDTTYNLCIGKPIIINGILFDNKDSYSVVDIIMRDDYIEKLFSSKIEKQSSKKSIIGYNYSIISVNFKTITINNNNYVSNKYKYKNIYQSYLLKNIIGYIPRASFMIGNKYKKKNDTLYDPYSVLATIKYENYIVDKVKKGFMWIKNINYKPMPNMKNLDDYPWKSLKEKTAIKDKEMTLLWYFGINYKNAAEKYNCNNLNDISNILDNLNMSDSKKNMMRHILDINNPNNLKCINTENICDTIPCQNKTEFFVDFEFINFFSGNFNDDFINDKIYYKNIIYLIGVGWKENNKWNFKSFVVESLDEFCESKIIMEFINFIGQYNDHILYHWGSVENTKMKDTLNKYNIKFQFNWFDLLTYFKNNYITVKNSYNFGLKNIAKSLYKHGLINTTWENDIDGNITVNKILEIYKNNMKINDNIYDIIEYNQVDCKVLYDIVNIIK